MTTRQALLRILLFLAYLALLTLGFHSIPLVIDGQLPETGVRSTIFYLTWFIGAFSGWIFLRKLDSALQKYVIAIICLLAFLSPPWSQDVFNYVASSRTWMIYDKNPYLYSLHFLNPDDPFLGASVWDIHVTPYGPLMTFLQAPLGYLSLLAEPYFANLGRSAILIPVYGFKLTLLLLHFLNIALVSSIAKELGYEKDFQKEAIWLYALNPIILYESIATGHNDLILASLLLFGFYLFVKKQTLFSSLFALLAFLCKYTSGILLAFYLVYFLSKKEFSKLFIFLVLSTLVILNTALWIESLPTYKLFLSKISEISWGSLPHYFAKESFLKNMIGYQTVFVFFYALGCFSSLSFSYYFLKERKYLEAFLSPLFIFCLYTTPVYNNWYLILPTSFACLLRPSALKTSVFIFAASSQLALLQFAIYRFDIWPHPETQIALTFIPTIVYILVNFIRSSLAHEKDSKSTKNLSI